MSSVSRAKAKSAINLRVRRDLLEAARASKINLSSLLEQALIEKLNQKKQLQWRQEKRESMAAYNEHVRMHAVFAGRKCIPC